MRYSGYMFTFEEKFSKYDTRTFTKSHYWFDRFSVYNSGQYVSVKYFFNHIISKKRE
jgi:hypothetical protein